MQCKSLKDDGTPCNGRALADSEFCYPHSKGFLSKISFFLADLFGVKRRFLIWSFSIWLIIFIIQLQITYQYNEIRDSLKLRPNVELEISPYLQEAPFGEYLPLIVTNTGDYSLEDLRIRISACSMLDNESFETYHLPLLPAHSERVVPFANKQIIQDFKKGNCYPFAGENRSAVQFKIYPYNLSSQIISSVGCGICFFNATIFGNYYEGKSNSSFIKTLRSYMDFPVELSINISMGNDR